MTGGADQAGAPPASRQVRARDILRLRPVWVLPIVLASVLIILVAFTYIGSVVNPAGHLDGLPVLIVDQDTGAVTSAGPVDFGHRLASGFVATKAVSGPLALSVVSLGRAEQLMDQGKDLATLVIPPTFSASLVQLTGRTSSQSLPLPSVQVLNNVRLGSLGVSLADAVLNPAVAAASHQVATQLLAAATPAAKANAANANRLVDPVAVTSTTYHPLPGHTALGLSAFYISLLSIMCGFLGATVVNSSIDAALGYGATEIGPRYRQRKPLLISRRKTLLVKWAVATAVAPLLTALLLLVSAGILGMDAPHLLSLWLFLSLSAVTVAVGTIALFAAFGSLGQLVGMIFFIYLALASSGGTVPIQALPTFFRAIGGIEPLRLILAGSRSILYLGARSDAGLGHSIVVIAVELAVWVAIGLLVTAWYDRRGLHRLAPDMIAFVERAVEAQEQALPAT